MTWPLQAHTFMSDPAQWADPALAAPVLSPGLQTRTAKLLLGSQRFAARASAILARSLGEGEPNSLDPIDRFLVLAGPDTLAAIASQAGAVWHGGRVRAIVMAGDLAALRARHGTAARERAMQHRALTPNALTSNPGGGHNLLDDIETDGARCVTDWTATLPTWAARRVHLIWAPRPGSADPSLGTKIVRAVAGDLAP